jgi:hypothetical protein
MSARTSLLVAVCTLALAPLARPFCGFYVAKADTRLFNKASRVVLVRDGDRTFLTMANDYKGDPKEFAVVIPVPTFIERKHIELVDPAVLDHLDAYTAPRLVEYFDEDPCRPRVMEEGIKLSGAAGDVRRGKADSKLGVTVEAQYSVGEYEILILSAKESSGLETWLKQNGYRIPQGAGTVLASYIRQNMRFFVAKVNLKEQAKLGFSFLRPLRVESTSPKFMLPIRLGTVNADGPQELFVFALSRKGRVETTNYRTVKLPTGMDVPVFVKAEFQDFYKAMFDRQVAKEEMRAVFLEYAWDMKWCDPCAADPLSNDELGKLGVTWLAAGAQPDVYVSRLHVRYDGERFPEDLVFQETADRENFQGRYVLRHPFPGAADCEAGRSYRQELARRREREAQTLASLTGWDLDRIRRKTGGGGKVTDTADPRPWYVRWLDR